MAKGMAITTIPISKKFHDWLKAKGKKGESYEDVIKRLLKPEYAQELQQSSQSSGNVSDDTQTDELV